VIVPGEQRVAPALFLAAHTPLDEDDLFGDDVAVITLVGISVQGESAIAHCVAEVISKNIEANFAIPASDFESLWLANDVFTQIPDTIEPWLSVTPTIHEPLGRDLPSQESKIANILRNKFFVEDVEFTFEVEISEIAKFGRLVADRWLQGGRPVQDTIAWLTTINHIVEDEGVACWSREIHALCMQVRKRKRARRIESKMIASLLMHIVENME